MTRALNSRLAEARQNKKDEFYTQLPDIERELKHYKAKFKGKVVYCNCDDPNESNFVKYFKLNFEYLGLKKLIATHFKNADLLTKAVPYKLEYTGNGGKGNEPNEANVKVEPLKGDGDFRGDESCALLEQADIVVTNPPFSLFREYVAELIHHKKHFLILGQQSAITYRECFQHIRDGKMWLGVDNGGTKWFQVPDDYTITTASRRKIEHGIKYFSMGSVFWYTNLDHKKRHEPLTLFKRYSKAEYPTYDNYDVINVDKVADIPEDYNGVMGVPITFLDKFNPKQFEIIGLAAGNIRGLAGIASKTGKDGPYLGGRLKYGRVFIKKRGK